MSPDLAWLTLSALLAASLWIPYVVGVSATRGPLAADFLRPPELAAMPAWVHRAHRAHLNMIEQLVPFAVVVLIAHAAGVSSGLTATAAAAFFWVRLAHAAGMITGLARFPLRPILYSAGWLCILSVAVALLRSL